jgi:hypothetical protein
MLLASFQSAGAALMQASAWHVTVIGLVLMVLFVAAWYLALLAVPVSIICGAVRWLRASAVRATRFEVLVSRGSGDARR